MRFSANMAMLLMMAGALSVSSIEGNAYVACDTHQMSNKPSTPNAISSELVIPFGFLCHHLEVESRKLQYKKRPSPPMALLMAPSLKAYAIGESTSFIIQKEKEILGTRAIQSKGVIKALLER